MSDLIDRQAAIDAIKEWGLIDGLAEGDAIEILSDKEKVPSAEPITEEDYTELHDRFGAEVEVVVRDMVSGEGKRWMI